MKAVLPIIMAVSTGFALPVLFWPTGMDLRFQSINVTAEEDNAGIFSSCHCDLTAATVPSGTVILTAETLSMGHFVIILRFKTVI